MADKDALIYRSDFNVASAEWNEGALASGSSRAFRQNGYLHILLNRAGYYCFLNPGKVISDFRVLVDAEFVGESGENTACGLVFRLMEVKGKTWFYRFLISRSGYYSLDSYINQEYKLMIRCFSVYIRSGSVRNDLMVQMTGQEIMMGVNGHVLAMMTDSKLVSGKVGLTVGTSKTDEHVEARFRNFMLYSIE